MVHQWPIRSKSAKEIEDVIARLKNRTGRQMNKLDRWTQAKGNTRSVQGMWFYGMWPSPVGLLNANHLGEMEKAEEEKRVEMELMNHPGIEVVKQTAKAYEESGRLKNSVMIKMGPLIERKIAFRGINEPEKNSKKKFVKKQKKSAQKNSPRDLRL